MPDIFIPVDTAGYSSYVSKLISKGIINRFAFNYVDARREKLKSSYKNASDFSDKFPVQPVLKDFIKFAEKEGVDFRKDEYEISSSLITNQILALMGRALYGNDGFYTIINKNDKGVKKAIELLSKNKLVANDNMNDSNPSF